MTISETYLTLIVHVLTTSNLLVLEKEISSVIDQIYLQKSRYGVCTCLNHRTKALIQLLYTATDYVHYQIFTSVVTIYTSVLLRDNRKRQTTCSHDHIRNLPNICKRFDDIYKYSGMRNVLFLQQSRT